MDRIFREVSEVCPEANALMPAKLQFNAKKANLALVVFNPTN